MIYKKELQQNDIHFAAVLFCVLPFWGGRKIAQFVQNARHKTKDIRQMMNVFLKSIYNWQLK